MKKQLLFVMDSLGIGGGEKSLVTLLSLIDYTKYDVDLQLFSNNGEFVQFLPNEVNLLPLLPYNKFLNYGLVKAFFTFRFKWLKARSNYSFEIRRKKLTHAEKAMRYWQICSGCYKNTRHYDVAIAYSQGLPTFYVVDKVNANKKIGWINCVWDLYGVAQVYNAQYYGLLDVINMVSKEAYSNSETLFPEYKQKFSIIKDIISPDFTVRMAKRKIHFSFNSFKILTVSRLLKDSKGYDILLDTAKLLRKRNVSFDWLIIGNGTYRKEMEDYIKDNNLCENVHLLGPVSNPYPYYRLCDLYVQTSRREGFGLSIAEARLLNCPVVTTEYVGVWSQMVQGKNGIVVPIDATAVADAIEDLILHPEKREAISAYQRTEKKGNTEEIEKFYKLLE